MSKILRFIRRSIAEFIARRRWRKVRFSTCGWKFVDGPLIQARHGVKMLNWKNNG